MSTTEQKYGTIMTNYGVNAVFKATTEGIKVTIDSIAVGDGDGAYYMPTTDITELKNEQWRGAIGSYAINETSPNMITVRAVIPATIGGFTIRELALFSDTGTMIAIANTPDIEKVIMEDGIFGTLEVSMKIVLTNAGTLNFVVDPSTITASAEDLENHNADPNAHGGGFGSGVTIISSLSEMNNVDANSFVIMVCSSSDQEELDPEIEAEVENQEELEPEIEAEVENQEELEPEIEAEVENQEELEPEIEVEVENQEELEPESEENRE